MNKTLQTPWYNKTVDALQIAGMSERTQQCYARAVRMLMSILTIKTPSQDHRG